MKKTLLPILCALVCILNSKTSSSQCPTGDLRELWYVKNTAANHHIFKYDMTTKVETVYTFPTKPTELIDQSFTDIGFAPNGDLYVVSFGNLWKVTIPTTGTFATIAHVTSYPSYSTNSLSFDLKGQMYIGADGSALVRSAVVGQYNNPTIWHNFGTGGAGGDFIFSDGYLYILWNTNTTSGTHMYRVVLGTNNEYVSHTDLGSVTNLIGNGFSGYGMARVGDDIYIGGNNNTLYKVTSFIPLTTAPVPTTDFNSTQFGSQIWGLTGRYEAFGDFVNPPSFPQATYAIPTGSTTIDLRTISPNPAAPAGTTVEWFINADLSTPVLSPEAAPAGEYYAAFKRAADGYIADDCFSPAVLITVSNILPVHFGTITAYLSNQQLFVEWSTLSEVNNNHFEIELSKDGKHFTRIGKVSSQAINGNSATTILYSFNSSNTTSKAVVGLSILLLISLILLHKRNKIQWIISAIAIGSMLIISSCVKENKNAIDDNATLFVRIKQVDTDGQSKYSKIVKVEKK